MITTTTTIAIVTFIKTLLLFMAILNSIKESFRLYKSLKTKKEYEIDKPGLFILGLSISYILTIIFV